MFRNLKILLASVMALTALGAMGAHGAQAAEFHCSMSPCQITALADGTAKNSHHVLVVTQGSNSVSVTCNSISGKATLTGFTSKEVTFTNLVYTGCTAGGESSIVTTGTCDYLFTNDGTVHLTGCGGGAIHITLPATGCTFTIGGAQTFGGVSYATLGSTPTRTVTVGVNITGIVGTADDDCTSLGINPGEFTGDYTTGNTIATGETAGSVMADGWFL